MRTREHNLKAFENTKAGLLVFVILAAMFLIISCYPTPYQNSAGYENNTANTSLRKNQSIPVQNYSTNISETNASENITIRVVNETSENASENKNKSEQATSRPNGVEFYFLLRGKTYFKDILREQQARTYNLSGSLITIKPIIITNDSVKFMVNNYSVKALHQYEWGSDDNFDIYVNEIYFVH
jgi:hypothetical protein